MKLSNDDRLQAIVVDRLVTSIGKSEALSDIQTRLDKAQQTLVEEAHAAARPIAEKIELDTATYDKNGNAVDNGVPKSLGELFVLHELQSALMDEIRKQIARCLNEGNQRIVISQILDVSSPNLYRTYDAGAQPGHTIEDYRKDSTK